MREKSRKLVAKGVDPSTARRDAEIKVFEGHSLVFGRETIDLSASDDGLLRLSREGMLALSLDELHTIRDHFAAQGSTPGRRGQGLGGAPTDVELDCLAQTWSEHCKHKIFNAVIDYQEGDGEVETIDSLFSTYIQGTTREVDQAVQDQGQASWLVSVFHDNAGVVAFDDEMHLVYKVETHNSPSALDPYGGDMTGIVGVNRDPFGRPCIKSGHWPACRSMIIRCFFHRPRLM